MGDNEVRDLETNSMSIYDMSPDERRKKKHELIQIISCLIDKFGQLKSTATIDDLSREQYTKESWQYCQILSSFKRIEDTLWIMKFDYFLKSAEQEIFSEMEERITKLIAKIRGGL